MLLCVTENNTHTNTYMKNHFFLLCCALVCATASPAQTGMGIGTTTPDSSAVLEIASATKGLLIPRLPSATIAAIDNPAQGLLAYDTDKNLFVYNLGPDGTKNWQELSLHSRGMVMMWSGAPAALPYGWALCDGGYYDSQGNAVASTTIGAIQTPDLRGRFIAGYSGTGDYMAIGNFGGEETHTLTEAEMPSHTHSGGSHAHSGTTTSSGFHSHTVNYTGAVGKTVGRNAGGGEDGADDRALSATTEGAGSHTHSVSLSGGTHTHDNTGGGQAHENRPPYYVLAYIMKL